MLEQTSRHRGCPIHRRGHNRAARDSGTKEVYTRGDPSTAALRLMSDVASWLGSLLQEQSEELPA